MAVDNVKDGAVLVLRGDAVARVLALRDVAQVAGEVDGSLWLLSNPGTDNTAFLRLRAATGVLTDALPVPAVGAQPALAAAGGTAYVLTRDALLVVHGSGGG